ncbi:Senescence regulator [Senna tora]|uniref:Senescence regulator n=1 Tax=Senna tora TaxID=362788 RepID=A0A834SJZ2_9FABA|nr:Senescence regulator [Senna tora]
MPPHVMVARKSAQTCSVLEGAGRTLKGRDLRMVRNAVWRQTGFID